MAGRSVLHLLNNIITSYSAAAIVVSSTIAKVALAGLRFGNDLIRQAISDERREGFIQQSEARQLRRRVEEHLKSIRSAHTKLEPAST